MTEPPPRSPTTRCIWVPGPVIVGAGPSGLGVAACLKAKGVPSLILEHSNCIASLWHFKTYDRLRLHLPKQFCELPLVPFPSNFPTYPSKQQFLSYLHSYADPFGLESVLNRTVVKAEFDRRRGFWRVKAVMGPKKEETKYFSRWLVAATGENAEEVLPEIQGMDGFNGTVIHARSYKSGETFRDKKVLVVGCGNSGMEVFLDLCNFNALASLVVRNSCYLSEEIHTMRRTRTWTKLVPITLGCLISLTMAQLWMEWALKPKTHHCFD